MISTDLHRLIYRSRSEMSGRPGEGADDLDRLVLESERRNAVRGVTGSLLVAGETFIQALEGDGGELELLFETICCDLRHSCVELIEFGPVHQRRFGSWGLKPMQPQTGLQSLLRQLDLYESARDSEVTAEAVRLMAAVIASNPSSPSALHLAPR